MKFVPMNTKIRLSVLSVQIGFILFICSSIHCSRIRMFSAKNLQNYQLGNIENLAIIFLTDDIVVKYNEPVWKVFGKKGKRNELIKAFLRKQIPEEILKVSIFKNVNIETPDSNIKLHIDTLKAGLLPKFRMKLPLAGTRISCSGKYPEYILFLQNCVLDKTFNYSSQAYPGNKVQTKAHQALRLKSYATIWDNNIGKIIFVGNLEARKSTDWQEIPKDTWHGVVEAFAEELVRNTDFKRRDRF